MSFRVDRNLTLIGLAMSLVLFASHYVLPEKRLTLYPNKIHAPGLYGFVDVDTGQSSRWLDSEKNEWACDYQSHHTYGCGWNLHWESADVKSIDMRSYDYLDVSLDYEGPATRIRLFMRNYNEIYSSPGDATSTKFMSMTIPVAELNMPVRVNMNEFFVASWWLQERNIRRQWALPEFDRITSLGMDFIEPGMHKTRIKHVVLSGQWVKSETLLLVILGFWMAVFLTDGFVRFYRLYAITQRERNLIRSLEEKQLKVEAEKRDMKALADTDPLTGVYNRVGMKAHIAILFDEGRQVKELGLMLLDIDNFKQLNDTHGHDMGDKVLRAFAAAMSANLRDDDLFARWGGEKFVVLCNNTSRSDLMAFAEKLREITAGYTFGSSFEITITVSIGVTVAHTGNGFDEAFNRANKALYRAKSSGRNRVEFES